MAIEKNNDASPGQAQPAPTAAQRSNPSFGGNAQQDNQRQPQQRQLGISDVNGLRRASIGRTSAGESVEGYKRAFEKRLEGSSAEEKAQFQFEVMNRDTDKVFMSTLLVTRPLRYNNAEHVLVYALPVEASNPIEGPRSFQNHGQTSEISWAASDVLDGQFMGSLERFIHTKFGSQVNVIYAGGRPLPQELKTDDESHLERVLFEVDQALLTATENQVTGGPAATVSVAMFVRDGSRASVVINPMPTERDDSVGNPVRSGINIELRATKNVSQNQMNQSLNQRDQDMTLTRVEAFVEPTYDTRHLLQAPQWPGAPLDSRCFVPRVVIRAIDSAQELLSAEMTLLGLASTTALSQHIGNWANSLRPRNFANASSDLQRMTDIGALGLAAPLNPADRADLQRISTDPREFSDSDFETLIEKTFIQDPIYTLLVEESGERSWLTDVYQYAADNDADAIQAIIRAANNLTDGHFSRIWQNVQDQRIVHNDQNRVHLGYFVDNTGKRVDLQHVDTLAMLAIYGEKDKQLVFDWIQSFNPATGTLESRLALREQILRNTFNQVTIKGYGRTVTFFPAFLEALNIAIKAAGLEISPANTRTTDFHSRPQFGVLDPSVFGMGANRTGGVFSHGQLGSTQSNYRGIGGMMSGSYGRTL